MRDFISLDMGCRESNKKCIGSIKNLEGSAWGSINLFFLAKMGDNLIWEAKVSGSFV
jgi:hypothetical protein